MTLERKHTHFRLNLRTPLRLFICCARQKKSQKNELQSICMRCLIIPCTMIFFAQFHNEPINALVICGYYLEPFSFYANIQPSRKKTSLASFFLVVVALTLLVLFVCGYINTYDKLVNKVKCTRFDVWYGGLKQSFSNGHFAAGELNSCRYSIRVGLTFAVLKTN